MNAGGGVVDPSRWARLDEHVMATSGRYRWSQCRFCGRAQDKDCAPVACLLCGSRVCHGHGASCPVCERGWLPGYSRVGPSLVPTWRDPGPRDLCGRKTCEKKAVADAPRIFRVCAEHVAGVKVRYRGRTLTLPDYVAERVSHRDSGAGWEQWRFVIVSGEGASVQYTLVRGTELPAAAAHRRSDGLTGQAP